MNIHRNELLNAMSLELREKLSPHWQEVSLTQATVLHNPGDRIQKLYFPLNCLISVTITMSNGAAAETSSIGNRDVLGAYVVMGSGENLQTESMVQIAGEAIAVDAQAVREEFERSPELRNILLHHNQALIAQISQTAACNRLHVLEQRLACWLLQVSDGINSDRLALTQEFIAMMLGVRRAGVTQGAQTLQKQGLIRYSRGVIYIVDSKGLETFACECFQVVKDKYDRLLNGNIRDHL